MDKRIWKDISPAKMYKWPITLEKILNIFTQKGNTNQNHLSYDFSPTRMAIIKKRDNNKCWPGCGEIGKLYTAGRNVKWCSHCSKQSGSSSKYSSYHTIQQFHSYVYTQENWNLCPHKYLYTNVHSSIIHNSQKAK